MIDRRNIRNLYPLTPLQEGMLYLALRAPDSRAYFERLEFGLEGPLDEPAYCAAWQDITDRHDILRTLFAVRNAPRPLQVVLKQWPVALEWQDLTSFDADSARARIDAWKAADLARGFTLTAEVPLRLAVFRLGAERHRVVWSFHHILLDGWCLAILQRELDACYLARLAGTTPHLPPAPPYATYVRWLEARDKAADTGFWTDLLDGFNAPTPVPRRLTARFVADHADHNSAGDTLTAATESGKPAEHCHTLDAAASAALADTVRSLGVTPNSVVQTLWGLLLAAGQGSRDAVFAATVAGRPMELPGAEATVGLFINAVPVRVRFADAATTIGDVIRQTHAQGIAARPHHATPLAEVQAQHPLRERLIDHILVFENYPQDATPTDPRLPRTQTDDAIDLHEYTHYGFEFQFLPGTPAVLRFRFDVRRYEPGAIARLGERFAALLQVGSATPVDSALAALIPTWRGPRRVALAASFTAEPVADALTSWLRQFAQPAAIALAPYNQCPHALLDPASALTHADLAFLLYRPADALRDLDELAARDPDAAAERLVARHAAMQAAFDQWCVRTDVPSLIVALLPTTCGGTLDTVVQRLTADWHQHVIAAASPRIVALDLADPAPLTGLPLAAWPDADAQRLGHVPYTEAGCAALGAALARPVLARARAPFKVLAVDCDNTLWQGICGEAGARGVVVGPAQQALQRFLLARQAEGFLIALASKNAPADVWAVFDEHPDMLLRRQHIAAAAINWESKSGNLQMLARELNIGIDSFIFIDDNPAEVAEVMRHCPAALALALPGAPDPQVNSIAGWLALLWACDVPTVTAEDRERTHMMQAEAARQEVLAQTHDLDTFLAGIGLRIAMGSVAPHQLARVAQLTQRTNQFNLSGRRRDEAEIAALAARDDCAVLAIEVEDRFGAYGLTGVAIVQRQQESDGANHDLFIDTLLLSCRVLGRRVEHGILAALGRLATDWHCARILAALVPTGRNEPIRQFLAAPPWVEIAPQHYACRAADAIRDVPGLGLSANHVFAPPPPSPVALEPRSDPAGAATASSAAALHGAIPPLPPPAIENEAQLVHAHQYLPWLAAAAGWPAHLPPGLRAQRATVHAANATHAGSTARAPQPGIETTVAQAWADVLQLQDIPATVPFADLGGHSLHAVRVVSRLERTFGTRIGLARFYTLATVADMAGWLETQVAVATATAASIPPAPEADDYPLSHSQYRVWLLSRLGAAPAAYNQCAAYRLRGPLDIPALERAVQALIDRHEALRTRFTLTDAGPRQHVLVQCTARIEHATATAEEVDLDTLVQRIAAAARAPFDLETGPLLRVTLYRRGPADHVLALALHHIVGDGWSFGQVLADLGAAYRDSALPAPPPLRYRDYATWTRSAAHAAALAPHRTYWRERLGAAGTLPALPTVPTDRPRPPEASGRGGALQRLLLLAAPQRDALERCQTTHAASLFQFLASLVMVLIARHGEALAADADDANPGIPVRIGTPVAGRDRPELEDLVGICVNTLVLDARVRIEQPFAALLADVRSAALAALDHQSYPFDRLVEDLAPARDASRNPLFDVLVALQNAPRASDGLAGLQIEDLQVPLGIAAFDLVFEFAPAPEGLMLELTYASDLYTAATAARLVDRLEVLLHATLADPACTIGALPLLNAAEAAQLAAFASGPQQSLPTTTLPQCFAARAAERPHAPALLTNTEILDFASLSARVDSLALALAAAGVGHGERVAVLLPRDATWPVALLATLRAGAVYLPLEARHPPARLREVLADARPALLLTTAEFAAQLQPPATLAWLDPSAVPPAPTFSAPTTFPIVSPDDEAYLLYTSGSTGTPKGVRITHRAFMNMIEAQIAGFAVTQADVVLQLASCAFDASLSEFFLGWLAGAPVALADATTVSDSARLGRFLARHRVTLATFTPSYLQQLEDADLAGLRRVIVAGEAVHGSDVARLLAHGIVPYNAYGPTETAVCATLGRITAAAEDTAPVPIGRPLANLTVRLSDPRGLPAPIGVPGEIEIFGAGVALGYWQRPELNARHFIDDPQLGRGYRSGDLARWLSDGRIEYLGRRDAQVKLRGLRVEPGEIVARLLARPGVRQAAVSVESGPAGAELVAWISPENCAADELKTALATTLPAYMIPTRWIFLPSLPLTPSGKLDQRRLQLPSVATTAATAATTTTAPASALEQELLGLWRDLLGPAVNVDSDFFAVGGNSLTAMKVARCIATAIDRPCPAILLFRHPTIRALATALHRESVPATPWQHWGPTDAPLLVALPPAPGFGAVHAPLAAHLARFRVWAVDYLDAPLAQQLDDWADTLAADNATPVLFGHSGGGRLALALAERLATRGIPPRAVILADTWRWRADDPDPDVAANVAAVLAELQRRAETDDRALASATGMHDTAAVVNRGKAYRRALAGLLPPAPLSVPIYHLLAEIDPTAIPPGFSRDWQNMTSTHYHTHPLAGGHAELLAGPSLPDNAGVLCRMLDELMLLLPPHRYTTFLEEV